jgi:hypothetical protein
MMQLLEPKFIGLVNNNEEHFIVRRTILPAAFRILCVENFVELEVIVIVNFSHRRILLHEVNPDSYRENYTN